MRREGKIMKTVDWENFVGTNLSLCRCKTDSGWLVKLRTTNIPPIFISDPGHTWDWNSEAMSNFNEKKPHPRSKYDLKFAAIKCPGGYLLVQDEEMWMTFSPQIPQ